MADPEPLDPEIFGPESPCFGCSPRHPVGFHLTFSRQAEHVTTTFVPDERLQGPPGVMHGGLVTTLADEIAAWTVIGQKNRFGFTAAISAKLHKPVRIGTAVVGRGKIVKESARVLTIEVQLAQAEDRVFTGEFTFVLLDAAGAERILGGPLPEAWARFARGAD